MFLGGFGSSLFDFIGMFLIVVIGWDGVVEDFLSFCLDDNESYGRVDLFIGVLEFICFDGLIVDCNGGW